MKFEKKLFNPETLRERAAIIVALISRPSARERVKFLLTYILTYQ
jgi:hypothetical protein